MRKGCESRLRSSIYQPRRRIYPDVLNLAGAFCATLPPLVAADLAGKPEFDLRVLEVATQRFPHAEFGLGDALFKKK